MLGSRGGLFAGGGGLFAGGPFAAGLIAGGLNAATQPCLPGPDVIIPNCQCQVINHKCHQGWSHCVAFITITIILYPKYDVIFIIIMRQNNVSLSFAV